MSNQQPRHDKWTDLLKPTYDYPDDLNAVEPGRRGRRQRRQAKKEWREADRMAREEFLAARRAEPVAPEARLGFALFLTVIVVIAAVVWSVRAATGEDPAPAAAASSSAEVEEATSSAPSSSPTPAPSSSDDVEDQEQAAAGRNVEETVRQWAAAWFTYTPASGDSQSERMDRAEPLMTQNLAAFLWEDDATATGYEKSGTDIETQPDAVKIGKAPGKAAPPDTDLRVTRRITVRSTYTAGPQQGEKIESVYLVTLLRDEAAGWQVSEYIGQEH